MLKQKLVSRLVIDSQSVPDPICEPFLAGKMHANPFPSLQSRSPCPLELIHTDVHGPLPVCTHSSFHYWVTFIAKSDTFEAFKAFKAYAENHHNAKIKMLRDDKGGECW